MGNIVKLPGKGNHPPSGNDNNARHLCRRLDLHEAERHTWLRFRVCHRIFCRTRSLADEIVMIEARDLWDSAFRQVEHCEVAA